MPTEHTGGRVLLVEDDGVSRILLARSLRDLGHIVAEAEGSRQALEWVRSWIPDVVLLDRFLPDGDGMQVLAELKADASTRDIPVVMVTGSSEPAFVVEALRAGAHDYLVKPFVLEELMARTQAALRTKLLTDELRLLASHDQLTGLRNRRAVTELVSSWRGHCKRHGLDLTLALVDLSEICQGLSPAAFDRAVRGVSESLLASVRIDDVVGRWSPQQLIAVLPRADAQTTRSLLGRVSARLREQHLLPEGRKGLPAGIVVVPANSTEDDEQLLESLASELLAARRGLATASS